MRAFTILSGFAATILPTVFAGDAPETKNQPTGVQYVAHLPDSNTTTFRGDLMIAAGNGGEGVLVQAAFQGLLPEGGPFREYS